MVRIAGIIRKSPTKKENRINSVKMQKEVIKARVLRDFPDIDLHEDLVWFIDDNVSGDDPNRPELNKFFKYIDSFDFAYCHVVDRFSRSYLGLHWFNTYFITDRGLSPHNGCMLRFVEGIGNLYEEHGLLNPDTYLFFFMQCGFAQAELIKNRKKCNWGRDRLRKDPELWKQKFRGRPR